jgi:dinuclear metal center YbgI/SA1388 family protein
MSSLNLYEIKEKIEKIFPPEFQESWDNSGLMVGSNIDKPINKILLTVDITPAVVAEAIEINADLILAHHPLFFKPIKTLATTNSKKNQMIIDLIQNNIAVYSAHTSADRVTNGVADFISESLGIFKSQSFENDVEGLGRYGTISDGRSIHDLLGLISGLCSDVNIDKEAFWKNTFYSHSLDTSVRNIAVLPGSGDSELDNVAQLFSAMQYGEPSENEVDLYITSDLRHHPAQDFLIENPNIALVSIAHSYIEKCWFAGLKNSAELCAETVISRVDTNPWIN